VVLIIFLDCFGLLGVTLHSLIAGQVGEPMAWWRANEPALATKGPMRMEVAAELYVRLQPTANAMVTLR